jgi:hypothetical protein
VPIVMTATVQTEEYVAQTARSRATGCLFFIGFGTIWMLMGLGATQHGSPLTYTAVGVVSAGLLAMVAMLFRRARELPEGTADSDFELRAKKMFAAVNIIQWVSIVTAVSILNLLHMPEYIVPAIAILVGLHLFPLAGSFRHRQHYVTGTLLLVWSMGALAIEPRERVAGVAALGTGLVLLVSAAWTLVTCLIHDAPIGSANARA